MKQQIGKHNQYLIKSQRPAAGTWIKKGAVSQDVVSGEALKRQEGRLEPKVEESSTLETVDAKIDTATGEIIEQKPGVFAY